MLTLAVLIGMKTEAAAAVPFSDISNHWAKEEINALAQKGIVRGMEEDRFRPDLPLTRGQFITMLHRVLEVDDQFDGSVPPIQDHFSDVTDSVYYADELYNLKELGIVDDQYAFYGEKAITRETVAHYLRKAYEYETGIKGRTLTSTELSNLPFKDQDHIRTGYKEDVYYTQKWGLFHGYSDGRFGPKDHLTRAQGAAVIFRLYQLTQTEKMDNVSYDELNIRSGQDLELIYRAENTDDGVKVTFSYKLPSPAYVGKIKSVTMDNGTVVIVINKTKIDDNMYPQVITIEQKTILIKTSQVKNIKIMDSQGEFIKEFDVS